MCIELRTKDVARASVCVNNCSIVTFEASLFLVSGSCPVVLSDRVFRFVQVGVWRLR
jgi:hypothetical protein